MNRAEYIQHIIQTFRFKTKNEADRLLKLHYETTFGIINHQAAIDAGGPEPDSALRHPGMNVGGYDVIERLLRNYEEFHVYDITKMSFLEYIALPKPMMYSMNLQCQKLSQLRDKAKAEMEKAGLEELTRKAGGARMDPLAGINLG